MIDAQDTKVNYKIRLAQELDPPKINYRVIASWVKKWPMDLCRTEWTNQGVMLDRPSMTLGPLGPQRTTQTTQREKKTILSQIPTSQCNHPRKKSLKSR